MDHRADIYSLGATFYEMLAVRPPFVTDGQGDSDFKLKLAHLQQAPPDPREFYEHIPAGLAQVVLRCLEKSPEERYQTVGELQQALAGSQGQVEKTRIENGIPLTDVRSPTPKTTSVTPKGSAQPSKSNSLTDDRGIPSGVGS